MSACSNIIDQIGSDNLTIVYFGVRYDNVADLKTSTAGLSKNLIIADLGGNLVNSSSFSKLYSDCFISRICRKYLKRIAPDAEFIAFKRNELEFERFRHGS